MRSSPPHSPVVLVVDNDAVNRKLLADVCQAEGYDVVAAEDGESALDLFRAMSIDIVLLDAAMPRKDGYEVCAEIRAESEVPVIVVTASTEPSAEHRAISVGATAFLTKPFRIHDLVRRIRVALTAFRSPSEPPNTGQRQRCREAARVLSSLGGGLDLRKALRNESGDKGSRHVCLVVRVENERQLVQRSGRHVSDAVLGSIGGTMLRALGQGSVFCTDSNELACLTEGDRLDEAVRAAQGTMSAVGELDVGAVVLRFGAVCYRATGGTDADAILSSARQAAEEASRSGETIVVRNMGVGQSMPPVG